MIIREKSDSNDFFVRSGITLALAI
jgi:hypothetical protein